MESVLCGGCGHSVPKANLPLHSLRCRGAGPARARGRRSGSGSGNGSCSGSGSCSGNPGVDSNADDEGEEVVDSGRSLVLPSPYPEARRRGFGLRAAPDPTPGPAVPASVRVCLSWLGGLRRSRATMQEGEAGLFRLYCDAFPRCQEGPADAPREE